MSCFGDRASLVGQHIIIWTQILRTTQLIYHKVFCHHRCPPSFLESTSKQWQIISRFRLRRAGPWSFQETILDILDKRLIIIICFNTVTQYRLKTPPWSCLGWILHRQSLFCSLVTPGLIVPDLTPVSYWWKTTETCFFSLVTEILESSWNYENLGGNLVFRSLYEPVQAPLQTRALPVSLLSF